MLKTVSSVANALGALNYKGTWNAATNTPTLASGVGTQGDYYVVSVDGTTDLDGITNWGVGDWAAFNGSVWQRVEGGADGNFVQLTVSGNADVEGDVTAGNQALLKTVISEYSMEVGGQYGKMVGTKTGSGVGGLEFYSYSGGLYKTADLTNSGNLNLTTGNLIVSSGAGIDFSATAGTGTSELFDDYEEGTWTPAYSASGLSGITYLIQQGTYTKIGRAVYVVFYIGTTGTFTSGSSALTVSGLPFTSASTTTSHVGFANATRFTTAPVSGRISDNTTSMNIYSAYNGTGTGTDPVSITGSNMISTDGGNNNIIQASAMYFV